MKRKLPPNHPDVIADKAKEMPWKENARVNVLPYETAILALRERGYSFGEIAEWLTKELGAPVKRGQVYYVYQAWQEEGEREFAEAESRGEVGEGRVLPQLSEEEAELRAKEADKGVKGKGKR